MLLWNNLHSLIILARIFIPFVILIDEPMWHSFWFDICPYVFIVNCTSTPTQIINVQIFILFLFLPGISRDNCLSANIVNSYQLAKNKIGVAGSCWFISSAKFSHESFLDWDWILTMTCFMKFLKAMKLIVGLLFSFGKMNFNSYRDLGSCKMKY